MGGGQKQTPKRKPKGRHPHHRLTAVSIRTKPPGRHADGNGLYLVVDPSGARRWIWRGLIYGRRSDLGLGSVSLVSLAAARLNAMTIRQVARVGGDPRVDRQQARTVVPTFDAAARAVHAAHSATFKNTKHRDQWITSLENDVFPIIGDRPVNQISTADVLRVLSPIWLTKAETARRVKQRMEVVFDWAKASGFMQGDNPTEGLTKVLPKHKGDKEHHAALPYQAVPAFLDTLRTRPRLSPSVRRGLELLVLTATRTNELRGATWDEINFDTATWTVPAARMKNSRVHQIPLSARALELLRDGYAERGDSPWICQGPTPRQPFSDKAFRAAIGRLTTTPVTVHGFRSSFRDWSAERTNIPRDVCEAALAHTLRDKTEAAYKRTDLFEKRRDLMALWAQFVTSTPGDVIAIRA